MARTQEIRQGQRGLHVMRDQRHDAEMPRVGQRLHELLVESCIKGHDGEKILRNEDADIQTGCGRGLRRVGVDIAEFGCAADDFLPHFLTHAGFSRERLRHGDGADTQLPPNVTHGDTAHGGIKPPDLWMFARAKSVFSLAFGFLDDFVLVDAGVSPLRRRPKGFPIALWKPSARTHVT